MAKQKPQYLVNFPDKDPSVKPAADSVKSVISMVKTVNKDKAQM
jgi:hypothetical protein